MTKPALARDLDGRRVYPVMDMLTPSVNTLAGLVGKPALEQWRLNRHLDVAYDRANLIARSGLSQSDWRSIVRKGVREDTTALDAGDIFHGVAEAVIGRRRPMPDDAMAWMVGRLEEFMDALAVVPKRIGDRVCCELTVCRVEDGRALYAGTADLFADVLVPGNDDHTPVVADWKLSLVDKRDIYDDQLLTTSAYALCTHYLDAEGMAVPLPFSVSRALVVKLTPGDFSVYMVEPSAYLDVIRALAAIWRHQETVDSPVAIWPTVEHQLTRSLAALTTKEAHQ